jgi:hypothetical protein
MILRTTWAYFGHVYRNKLLRIFPSFLGNYHVLMKYYIN